MSYARKRVAMEWAYKNAKQSPKYRVLGGVAFLRFGLGFTCSPGAYKSSEHLPTGTLPEVKIKLVGFHTLHAAGDKIKQITYTKSNRVAY